MDQKLLETVADIAYILGRNNYFSGDSRADVGEIIFYAEDFESKNTDWSKEDYISKIESFATNKINELRSLNNY